MKFYKYATNLFVAYAVLRPWYFMRSELFFQTSPWFIILCLVLGAGYAFLLYKPEQAWDQRLTWLLGILRSLLISLVCFLLLSPFVKTVSNTIEKAKIVFALDNSLSVGSVVGESALPVLKEAAEKLKRMGYEVDFVSLSNSTVGAVDSILFSQKRTDLSGLLSGIASSFEGRNLTDVIVFSDGIVNQGLDPSYLSYPFRVHALGLGDTLAKKDLEIRNVVNNRMAVMGNAFPVQVDVVAHGLAGKSTTVQLKQGSKVLDSRSVIINNNDFFATYSFQTSSGQKGIQQYTVEVSRVSDEHTLVNNVRKVYVDVIDGKQKILLLGLAPHPDIKAIRALVERNENYELDVKILSSGTAILSDLNQRYDLVILHQLPDIGGLGGELLRKLMERPVPMFFLVGNQSSLGALANLSKAVQVAGTPGQVDKVSGNFNSSFQSLNLDSDKLDILTKLPPMAVPFASYRLTNGTEVVLHQRIGSLVTQKPLLLVNTALQRKVAILFGEGLWQWRMEEYALSEKQEIVDDLFGKLIQLLAVKEDKRKFRVYPTRAEFDEGDPVVFQTEIYNDIYERVFGQEVRLEIVSASGERKQYAYQNSEDASRFEISGLKEGVYKYRASATLKNGVEEVSGQFVVRNVNIELLSTTANFNLLRELTIKNGGRFSKFPDVRSVIDELSKERRADRLDSAEEMLELINLKWLFFVLLILATIEWTVRKYNGSY